MMAFALSLVMLSTRGYHPKRRGVEPFFGHLTYIQVSLPDREAYTDFSAQQRLLAAWCDRPPDPIGRAPIQVCHCRKRHWP